MKKKTKPAMICDIHVPVGVTCRITRGHVVDVGELCVVQSEKDGLHRVRVALPSGSSFQSDVLGRNLEVVK